MSVKEEVLSRLDSHHIPYTCHEHAPVSTMEDCLALPFVNDEVMFCKNILLCNRQQTDFYLYLTPPDKPFRTADVSKKLQPLQAYSLSFRKNTLQLKYFLFNCINSFFYIRKFENFCYFFCVSRIICLNVSRIRSFIRSQVSALMPSSSRSCLISVPS